MRWSRKVRKVICIHMVLPIEAEVRRINPQLSLRHIPVRIQRVLQVKVLQQSARDLGLVLLHAGIVSLLVFVIFFVVLVRRPGCHCLLLASTDFDFVDGIRSGYGIHTDDREQSNMVRDDTSDGDSPALRSTANKDVVGVTGLDPKSQTDFQCDCVTSLSRIQLITLVIESTVSSRLVRNVR